MAPLLASLLAALAAVATVRAAPGPSLLIRNPTNDDNPILRAAVEIPVCANLCFFQAAVAVGCATDDYHCRCGPVRRRDQLVALTHNCLAKSCDDHQARHAHALADSICEAVARGVPNPSPQPLDTAELRALQGERRFPEPFPDAAPGPFPGPVPDAAPPQVTEAPFLGLVLARRGADPVGSLVSSIPSSIVPAATELPTPVATAGASHLQQAPAAAAVLAGACAVGVVVLLV